MPNNNNFINIGKYWKISECSLQTLFDNIYEGFQINDNNEQIVKIFNNIG